ncbi:MAG TPA: ATP-binding protein [Methylotenera sp.]|nr:ATP-binding protein [Methylotenera sp.]
MRDVHRLPQVRALLPPFIAFLLQWTFWDALQPFAWSLFYPAVFLSAWIGGLRAGLLCTFVSVVMVKWFFIPPQFSFTLDTHSTIVSISAFALMGIVISITLDRMREMIKQLDETNATLRASEERYRMLFNAMDEGFCVIEMLYDQTGKATDYRFIEINHAFENQTGLEQAVGKTILEMVPDHDAHWFEIYGKVALTGKSVRYENQAKAMHRHYDVFASRIGGDGSHQVGVLFKDITERKQSDLALVSAKEQAELANRAKDSFLATMSHEIRTPLTGMLGMLEVLSLTSLDREQNETLQAAWESGRSLLRIVSDILDWSKIEEGKLELAPRPTSIPHLLQEVVNTYSRVASAKSLMISYKVDSRLSPSHIVDPLRLSQVLNNFVSNAIKFTSRGEIELRADLLNPLDSGECVRFSVRDTGIGMNKEVQKSLFQRYRQESADTARMYGGTGLGLAICRRLAEIMDGKIELESEPGKGSTFSITLALPVSSAYGENIQTSHLEVEQKAVEPLFHYSEDAPLVLAVDDHPINRDLLAHQLKLLGLRAETAENGQVALSMWRNNLFNLVISDCHMPEMDGYALSRAIRKIEAKESRTRIPIIAWTANALAEESDRCHEASMDDLLVKPANLAQLKGMLTKWLPIAKMTNDQPFVSQSTEPNTDPIDFDTLKNIVADNAKQNQILRDFLTYIRADNLKLFEFLALNDHTNAEQVAHRMKGSSRMVGANHLANIYAIIEQATKDVDMLNAKRAGTKLDEACHQLEACLIEMEKTNGAI